jgi:hypothetical protein
MRYFACWPCAVAVLAAACVPLSQDPYLYDDGWRTAMVTEVGRGDAIRVHVTRDCRAELQPEVVASRLFARVTYSHWRNTRSMIAIVEEGDAPKRGMTVMVNTLDCESALKLGSR